MRDEALSLLYKGRASRRVGFQGAPLYGARLRVQFILPEEGVVVVGCPCTTSEGQDLRGGAPRGVVSGFPI